MKEEDEAVKKIVKQLRHGQITIPKDLREALDIGADDLLSIELVDGKLEVQPVKVSPKGKGSSWTRELYAMFAPVRESLKGRSEEEINQAIDEAVKEVRARRP
jgi:AbrB family looped-hinge helix DNA binding protein